MQQLHQSWPAEFAARYRAAGYWQGTTMFGFLRDRAQRSPDKLAVVGGAQRWTYEEFVTKAERLAAGFLALGLQPHNRVVVQLPNRPDFLLTVMGLFRAGLIPVYALPAHREIEVLHLVRTAEASAYVTADRHDGFDYRTIAEAMTVQTSSVKHIIIAGDAGHFISLSSLLGCHAALPDEPDPSEVAFLQISGGSTGLPKLIPRTHDDYVYSFRASAEICALTEDDHYLTALPAAHNFPMSSPGIFGTLYAGGCVIMCPSPNPAVAFPLIAAEKVTITGLVPPLALLWLQAAETTSYDLSSLRLIQVGGAKLLPEIARRIRPVFGCTLQQVFGMAEGLVNYTRLDDPEEVIIETQGRPISPDDEIVIVDDDDKIVPLGEAGNLLTRGPYTIRAYHNAPQANQSSFTADGFYRTGDIVRLTAEGNVVVQGRVTDHINRAGEKISAEEIEDHLLAHPDIFDAAVVSLPDKILGERSCAFIIPREKPIHMTAIKTWMRMRNLAPFKIPDQVVFVDSFETTAVGKISRKDLRAALRHSYATASQSKED